MNPEGSNHSKIFVHLSLSPPPQIVKWLVGAMQVNVLAKNAKNLTAWDLAIKKKSWDVVEILDGDHVMIAEMTRAQVPPQLIGENDFLIEFFLSPHTHTHDIFVASTANGRPSTEICPPKKRERKKKDK